MTLTGRTLTNFVNRTKDFTINAKKACLSILNMTVDQKFDYLANLTNTDFTSKEKASIHLFCYDDFNKLYR